MNRILVATDGSEGADRAVDYAARRAKADGAELLIVNVMGGYGLPDKVFLAFTNDQNVLLKELLASQSAATLTTARDRAREAGVSTIVLESRTGEVAQTIIDIAHEKKADAIVVGKRGAGRVAGVLLGSVSQKLGKSFAFAVDRRPMIGSHSGSHLHAMPAVEWCLADLNRTCGRHIKAARSFPVAQQFGRNRVWST